MTLARKKPLTRKPAKRKAPRPGGCTTQRCGRRPASVVIAPDERYCKTHAMKIADKLVGDYVKGWYGTCVAKPASSSFWSGPVFNCSGGALQWAHLIPRGYRAVRHSPDNAVALFPAHHRWFDTHPLEREDMIRDWLGDEYDEMRALARTHVAQDLAEVIVEFRKRLADG